MPKILDIALPVHLYKSFDYLAPEELDLSTAVRGCRAKVVFNHQVLVGVVLGSKAHSDFPLAKLKPIDALLDQQPCIPAELMALCQWASEYYHYPLGETLHAALPKRLRDGLEEQREHYWRHTTEGKGLDANALKRARQQQLAHQALLLHGQLSQAQLKALDIPKAAMKNLEQKGLAEQLEGEPEHSVTAAPHWQQEANLPPSEQQQAVLEELRFHQFNCYLLEGVTGSGKTEIYLQAMTRVLNAGRQALVLIPEIGLGPQTLQRFQRRFKAHIATLHSNLSETERELAWSAARDGRAKIVIGTRLASLCPMRDLGLIIIDEEHDNSYRQQDNFRYSARDLSIYRAKTLHIPIILGSATPSLESLNNAIRTRYQHLRLTQRAGRASAPSLRVVDLKNQSLTAGLSQAALQEMQRSLERGQQAMVFVNRRGYAPALLCHHCGWAASCLNCDARMTLHCAPRHLHCHHCDAQKPVPQRCPQCHNTDLMFKGLGTEQLEQALAKAFPHTAIVRIDRDSTANKGSFEQCLNTIHSGEPCIVVGTQMLAKGHHLPHITCVVIVDADQGLMSADFRGLEKLGQLIIQVAGRAGRAENPGTVIIQSHQPDHPLLELLLTRGYHVFARQLLQERHSALLPPFTQLAIFRAESKRPENAVELLELVKSLAQTRQAASPHMRYLGPMPAFIERVKDRYRYQLQICSGNRKVLNDLLQHVIQELPGKAIARRTRWSLEVDGHE